MSRGAALREPKVRVGGRSVEFEVAARWVRSYFDESANRAAAAAKGGKPTALEAAGRRLVVLDAGEVEDDLVRDMAEVLTSFCARLYGHGSAKNRAKKALKAAAADE